MSEPTEDQIRHAVIDAQDAFWAVMVDKFPEVQTGDMDPLDAFAFRQACEKALERWLQWNHPYWIEKNKEKDDES